MSKESLFLFLLIFLEYACFPISSEVVLPLSGGLLKSQGIPFIISVIIASTAGAAGVSLTFLIGRYGGSPLLEKLMRRFPKTAKPILSSYRFFGDHGNTAVCFGRLVPICRTYISFIAGSSGEKYLPYLIYSLIGISLWNSVLLSIGYYFIRYKDIIFYYFNRYKLFLFFGGGAILVLYLLRRFTKSEDEADQPESK